MKKLLLISLCMLLGVVATSQTWSSHTWSVEGQDDEFPIFFNKGDLVVDRWDYSEEVGRRTWLLTEDAVIGSTLRTFTNKILVTDGTSMTATLPYADLIPQTTLPAGVEGRIAVLTTTDGGNMLYMFQDGEWLRFLPLNKPVGGVEFSLTDPNIVAD